MSAVPPRVCVLRARKIDTRARVYTYIHRYTYIYTHVYILHVHTYTRVIHIRVDTRVDYLSLSLSLPSPIFSLPRAIALLSLVRSSVCSFARSLVTPRDYLATLAGPKEGKEAPFATRESVIGSAFSRIRVRDTVVTFDRAATSSSDILSTAREEKLSSAGCLPQEVADCAG